MSQRKKAQKYIQKLRHTHSHTYTKKKKQKRGIHKYKQMICKVM